VLSNGEGLCSQEYFILMLSKCFVRGAWTRRQIEYQDEALLVQDYIQNEVSTSHPIGIDRSLQVSTTGCKSYLPRATTDTGMGAIGKVMCTYI
jgi:hypothetical protein